MVKKKIAVLLPGPLANDYRVIKVVSTLSKFHLVDVFYIDEFGKPVQNNFNDNVNLYPVKIKDSLRRKLLQHSFFCYEFNVFIKEVLRVEKQYNFIVANDLPSLFPAYKLSQKLKAKLVYDSHEIYVETINQFFPLKSNFIKNILFKGMISIMKNHGEKLERKLTNKCYAMMTVNESIADYFKRKYQLKEVAVVMNLPMKLDEMVQVDYRSEYGWSQTDKIFIYQGVLNEGRGLKLLVSSMKNVPENYKLIIVGAGVLGVELEKLVEKNNLNHRIKFVGRVSLKDLPKYTKAADFGINLLEDINLSKKMASPNKLFEYIHAGVPVLCTNTMENQKVLDKYKIGVGVENEIEKVVLGMKTLVNDFELDDDMDRAKTYYCWENLEDELMCIFNK